MGSFTMKWDSLNLEVECESISENKKAFDIFLENLPVKALQGHEMVGGWMLRDRAILLDKRSFDIKRTDLVTEKMIDAPIGRISFLFPQGRSAEILVKYDDCVDDRDYVPFARVKDADIEKLKQVGKAQWKSATRTKEVILVEFKK